MHSFFNLVVCSLPLCVGITLANLSTGLIYDLSRFLLRIWRS